MQPVGEIWIEGGTPLSGRVSVQGSKNAALPMMAAALLHDGKTVLHHCPRIADVLVMEQILNRLGAKTRWQDFIFSRQDLEAEKSDMAAPGIFRIMKKNTEITGYVRFLKYSSLKNKAALIFFI